MRPGLVATDLDGTIVRSDGTVSERTLAAMRAVEAAGVPFVMVTGRPVRWMADIAGKTGHRGLAICANGAVAYDLHTETVVRSSLLEPDDARAVVEALRTAVPGIAFAVERLSTGFAHEPSYVPRWDSADVKQVAEVDALLADGLVKLLARHEELDSDALLAAGRAAVGDAASLTHSATGGLLEISAAGITKASGLAAYAEELGVQAAEAVAFGDMPNDLPMLAWAGRGYAVANAHPEVLALADAVVPSNDDDGVAVTLETWF